jgi:hypothetical protein
MRMRSPGETGHHVLWCDKRFPGDFIAKWEVRNLSDAGLCIVFFAAEGLNGEPVLSDRLPPRNGEFAQYVKGEIRNYHISYYADTPHKPARGTANLRKNPGLHLIQEGEVGIPETSKAVHEVTLLKRGPLIRMWIDERNVIDWRDDGSVEVEPYGDGFIGFRQMKWTDFQYRNFRVWKPGNGEGTSSARQSAPAAPLQVDLDFELPTELVLRNRGTASSPDRFYYDVEDAYPEQPGKVHRFIKDAMPDPESAVSRLVAGIGYGGSRGFELSFGPSDPRVPPKSERMELYVARGADPERAMAFGDVRYLSYDLYVDPENGSPSGHATITQCWQLPTSVESFQTGAYRKVKVVPMWLALREVDGQLGYTLHLKNERAPRDGEYHAVSVIAGKGTFEPGWNTLVFRFEPAHRHSERTGRIDFWLNTTDESAPTHAMEYPWGITPQTELPEGLPPTGAADRFDVRLGLYRPKQESALRVVYDNIRFGESFAEVRPPRN